jgi:RNA polymerase sigma-70 factor, ECF subfamily
VVASLTRRFGDLGIAEEAAAEAFTIAVGRWPAEAVPPKPGAWLTTTANRRAIDRIRREDKRADKHKEAQLLYDEDPREPPGAIDDERLRLIFTCCHPALAMQTRVALTLRMVAGLTMPEIARAFLVQEATVGQRITRAKAKIKAAHIPYRVPSAEDLPARVSGVLAVLYLVFNEGYLATGPGTDPVRHDLIAEAIRLTHLIRALMPEDGEVAGLLALMLLTEARRTAQVSASGELVTLAKQDRGTWDAPLIAEGLRLVRGRLAAAAAGVAPGPYQILAAINAVHTSARDMRDTDWSQVVALYDQLVRFDRSPIIALSRAIAVAELDGPEVALAAIDRLDDKLAGYHPYHVARADLLRRLGRSQNSRTAYDKAIELAANTAEIAYLTRAATSPGTSSGLEPRVHEMPTRPFQSAAGLCSERHSLVKARSAERSPTLDWWRRSRSAAMIFEAAAGVARETPAAFGLAREPIRVVKGLARLSSMQPVWAC